MTTSESIKQLATALVGFHKEVGKVAKDAANPFFKSKYAPLSSILDAIDGPLVNNGLSVVQFPEGENGLTTRLVHTSGEWMEATYSMKPAKDDPQGRGSAITYQRRYAVGAVLSLNIDEDDDGNKASGRNGQPQPQFRQAAPAPAPEVKGRELLAEGTPAFNKALAAIKAGTHKVADVEKKYILSENIKNVLKAAEA